MPAAPKPPNEAERLEALRAFDILDTEPEPGFDDLALIASHICDAPIALVSLVDEGRQWFKAKVGLEPRETHRDLAFCAYAINQDEVMVVVDAEADLRFADNALVNGPPHIRFYAGAPLTTQDGYQLGTLCVIDQKPRTLDAAQREALRALSRQVVNLLELRRANTRLQAANQSKSQLLALLSHDMRSALQVMTGYAKRLEKKGGDIARNELIDIAGALRRASEHTDHLLDNLVEWTRLDTLDQPRLREVDINAMLADCVNAARSDVEAKQLNLSLNTRSRTIVRTNPEAMRAVLRNVLENAIKFSHAGGRIELKASLNEAEAVITVRDHGVGMDAESVATLFSDQERHPQAGTREEHGSGLGGRLVWRLAQQLGIGLDVESTLGEGTTVTIRVPR